MAVAQDSLHPLLAALVGELGEAALPRAAAHVRKWRRLGVSDCGEQLTEASRQLVEDVVISLNGAAQDDDAGWVTAREAAELTAKHETRVAIFEGADASQPVGRKLIERAFGDADPRAAVAASRALVEAFGLKGKRKLPKKLRPKTGATRVLESGLVPCPNCNSVRLPHANCPNCGAPVMLTDERQAAQAQVDSNAQVVDTIEAASAEVDQIAQQVASLSREIEQLFRAGSKKKAARLASERARLLARGKQLAPDTFKDVKEVALAEAPAAPAVAAPSAGESLAGKGRPGAPATGGSGEFEQAHPRGRGGKWIAKGAGLAPPGSGQPHPGDQAVVQLQQRLSQLGFQVDQNGQFGTTTEEAVKAFQAKYGLPTTGKVDEATVETMRNPPPVDAAEAKMSLMGSASIKQLKQSLNDLGYEYNTPEAITNSLKMMQRQYGLPVSGQYDNATADLIARLSAGHHTPGRVKGGGLTADQLTHATTEEPEEGTMRIDLSEGVYDEYKSAFDEYVAAEKSKDAERLTSATARWRKAKFALGALAEASYSSGGSDTNTPVQQSYGGAVAPGSTSRRMVGGQPEWMGVSLLADPDDRTPGMDDFMGDEPVRMPPNLREAPEDAYPSCRTCVHHNGKRLCALYSAGTDSDDLCDSWFTLSPSEQVNAAMVYAGVLGQVPGTGVQEAASTRSAKIQLARRKLTEAVRATGGRELEVELRKQAKSGANGAQERAVEALVERRLDEARRGMPGIDLAEAEAGHRKLKCPKCGTVQSATNKTCTNCGHGLSDARKAKFAQESVDELLDRALALDEFESGSEDFDGAYWLVEAKFSADERAGLAKKGHALPDGSYPIRNVDDLKNAISAFGRATDPKRVKAWIMKRARALKLTNLLPDSWGAQTQEALYEAALELVEVKSAAYPNLERVPGKQNWVDYAGGLPDYIERIAKHIHYEHGHPIGQAIQFAVGTVRRWCAGGSVTKGGASKSNVSASTKAKACSALAEWEKKKKSGGAAQKAAGKLKEAALDPGVLAVREALAEIHALDLPEVEVTQEQALAWMAELETQEAVHGLSIHFDPHLHPRDRRGEFADVLDRLMKSGRGGEVTLPNGVRVAKNRAGNRLTVQQHGRKVGTFAKPGEAADRALSATGIPAPTPSFGIQGTRFNVAFSPGNPTNEEIVRHALEGSAANLRSKNMTTVQHTPNVTTVYSYKEPIAHIDHGERRVYVNAHKYSQTTSGHRGLVERAAKAKGYAVQPIDRAEARRRAGIGADEPFEKLPAGVKPGDYTENASEWRQAGPAGQEKFTHYRSMKSGGREMLQQTPTGYSHTTMNRAGSITKIRELSHEEGAAVLAGRSVALARAQGVAQERHRRIENERVASLERGEKGRVVSGSSGSFLTPPGHPEQRFHVETDLRRRPENRSTMSLSHAVSPDSGLDAATRAAAQRKLDEWTPAPIEHPATQEWIRSTLGYYRSMFHDPAGQGGMTAMPQRDELANADAHIGVRQVRRYYPDFKPTAEHFKPGGYGQKAETTWHHEVESLAALHDKLRNSDLVRMTDKPGVTIHRIKGEGLYRNATHAVRLGNRQKIAYSAEQAAGWAREEPLAEEGSWWTKGASMNWKTGQHFFNGSPKTNRPGDSFAYTGASGTKGGGGEFGSVGEAQDTAQRRADVSGITHYVFSNGSEHWIAGKGMRNALFHDRVPVSEHHPASKGGGDPREDEHGLLPGETWPQRKARYAKQFAESGRRTATFERPGQKTPPGSAEEFAKIEHAGQRVTILTPHGQQRTGRTVMKGPAGWVLNLGGAHGTPGIAHEGNVVRVAKARRLREVAEEVVRALPSLRGDPGMVALLKAEEATLVRLPLAELLVDHGARIPKALRAELREALEEVAPVEDSQRRLQEATEAGEKSRVELYSKLVAALGSPG